jgi:hypothetical protein
MLHPPPARPRRSAPAMRLLALTLLFALCAGASAPQTAPAGGSYSLRKQAIAAGGGRASGGSYQLTGTVGQAVAGTTANAPTQIQQGFHSAAAVAAQPDDLFRNGFE